MLQEKLQKELALKISSTELGCPVFLYQKEEETGWTSSLAPDIWVSLAKSQPPIPGVMFVTFWKSAQTENESEKKQQHHWEKKEAFLQARASHSPPSGSGWAGVGRMPGYETERAGTHAALGRTQLIWSRTTATVTAPTNESKTYACLLSQAL